MIVHANDVLDLDLGDVVSEMDGTRYVFYGWTISTVNTYAAHFIRELRPSQFTHRIGMPWTYTAVYLDALEKKFPGITSTYRKKPDVG